MIDHDAFQLYIDLM